MTLHSPDLSASTETRAVLAYASGNMKVTMALVMHVSKISAMNTPEKS
jgi:hypothetical protein